MTKSKSAVSSREKYSKQHKVIALSKIGGDCFLVEVDKPDYKQKDNTRNVFKTINIST